MEKGKSFLECYNNYESRERNKKGMGGYEKVSG
jgi:hypothetical protein